MMMDTGASAQQHGMQSQPDWCASCSSRCCVHLGAHASTHLTGGSNTAQGSQPGMGADWQSGDCTNDEGDWRGSPPTPHQPAQPAPAAALFAGMAPRPQKRHSDVAFSPSKRARPALSESSFVCNLQHDMQL